MNEFDYEVMQRKRTANSARHRKNGSKSKKCSLPSDGMSQKEWKERNGEVMSYNLTKPMSYEKWKSLPRDIQQLYICTLQDLYDASVNGIAKMFGITSGALWGYVKRHGIVINAEMRKRTKEQMAKWERFMQGDTDEPTQETTPPQATEGAELHGPIVPSFKAQGTAEPPRKPGMALDSFTLQFSGEFDPDAIRNSLAMILQKGQRVHIQISCMVEG